MKTYQLGAKLTVRATFTPGPPTAYQAWLMTPDGVEVELGADAIAVDGANLIVTLPRCRQEGDYVVRVVGNEEAVGAAEAKFRVLNSRMKTPIPAEAV